MQTLKKCLSAGSHYEPSERPSCPRSMRTLNSHTYAAEALLHSECLRRGKPTLGGAAAQEPAHYLTSGRVKSRSKLGAAPASTFRVRPSPHQSCHLPARSVFSQGRFFVGAKPPHGERTRPSASASGKSRAVKDPARCSRAVNMTLTAAPVANGQSWVRGFEAWVRKPKGSKGAAATRRRV